VIDSAARSRSSEQGQKRKICLRVVCRENRHIDGSRPFGNRRRIAKLISGNPMIDEKTAPHDIAIMIESHLEGTV
jgi:hypothetical protein